MGEIDGRDELMNRVGVLVDRLGLRCHDVKDIGTERPADVTTYALRERLPHRLDALMMRDRR